MDARQFLAEFEHIAAAPGGIQRIRELVIHLAVSGRLIQSVQEPQVNSRNEYPYQIPDHWSWQRLDEISTYMQRGKGPTYASQGSTLIVSQKCVQWRGLDLSVARHADEASIADYGEERFLRLGDVLLNSTGTGTVGRVATYKTETAARAVADSHVTVIRPRNVLPEYLRYALMSPDVQVRMSPEHPDSLVSGTTKQVELALGFVKSLVVPIPPTEQEQQRIVAKVDELMALCDQLEAQQQRRETLGKPMKKSVFNAVFDAVGDQDFEESWQRIQNEWLVILERATDVAALKALILDLAATGRLSQPLNTDSQLEDWAITPGQPQSQTPFEVDDANEIADEPKENAASMPRPAHWASVELERLFRFIDYRGKTPIKATSGRVLITAKNVRPGKIETNPVEYISEASYNAWMTRGFPQWGDLLFTTEAPLGNVARIEEEPRFALAQRIIGLQPFRRVNTRYCMYFLMSPRFQSLLQTVATGTTAKGIKAAKLKQLHISIPASQEQDRIVRRVEKLLSLCAVLEKQLEALQKQAELLASEYVASITGIQTDGKQPNKMKAPKTELVSSLRLTIGNGQDAADRAPQAAPLAALLARNDGALPAKTLYAASGLEIDAFYQQLKIEMARGWIVQPEPAYVRERDAEAG